MNCHSQLVRFTEADVRRFGPASQAWGSDADAPQMWGTRRIGPDLAREGAGSRETGNSLTSGIPGTSYRIR